MSKHCPKCDTNLPEQAFSKDRSKPDGLCHYCKTCRKGVRKNPRFRQLSKPADYAGDLLCQKCGETKPATEFYLTRQGNWGSYCCACLAGQRKAWSAEHPEETKGYRAKAYKADPAKQLAASARWRANNRAYFKALNGRWRAAHPENVAVMNAKVRAKRSQAPIIDRVSLNVLYKRDRGVCSLCGLHVKRTDASTDHIIPVTKGGEHSYRNTALAHRVCNARKNNRVALQQMRLF